MSGYLINRCKRSWAFLALLTIGFLLSGCGRKAPPVPPGTLRPKPVKDLTYKVTPKGIELKWSVPVRNKDGSPLAWVEGFRLYRAQIPADRFCATCPPVFGNPLWIPFKSKPLVAKKVVYEDRTVSTGIIYTYQVKTVKGWLNVSDPSNRVTVAWHMPPGMPDGLEAEATPQDVRLYWSPPESWADGSQMGDKGSIYYRIYRIRLPDGKWKLLADKVKGTNFLDITARTGRQYKYKVSAVFPYLGTKIEGEACGPVKIVLKDLTPPVPPQGLVVVSTRQGVELLWQENPEPDLLGYYVYRRNPDGLMIRLNQSPLRIPRFIDRTRLLPGSYYYWVTAIDRAEPPNESSPSERVGITIQ